MKGPARLIFCVLLGLVFFLGISYGLAQEPLSQGKARIQLGTIPSEINVGDFFTLPVMVETQGEKLDTARLSLSFSPETLEVVHFQLGTLFPTISPGASLDNTKGIIYYGGFKIGDPVTKIGVLGTATFKAKKTGQGEIGLNQDALLYGAGEVKGGPPSLAKIILKIKESENKFLGERYSAGLGEEILFTVQSASHPDPSQWYANAKVEINWTASLGAKEFFFEFNQEAATNPVNSLPSAAAGGSQMIFENTASGINYFHLKTRVKGKDSNIVHYPVLVDIDPPVFLPPFWNKQELLVGQTTRLDFAATDLDSGLAYYQAGLDGKDLGKVKSPWEIVGRNSGEHLLEITAFDQAGNRAVFKEKFLVKKEASKMEWGKLLGLGGVVLIAGLLIVLKLFKKRK